MPQAAPGWLRADNDWLLLAVCAIVDAGVSLSKQCRDEVEDCRAPVELRAAASEYAEQAYISVC